MKNRASGWSSAGKTARKGRGKKMAIVLRCHSCRRFFSVKKDKCPGCGSSVTLKDREIYFRRDIKGQRSVKRFEGTSLRQAQEEYGLWLETLDTVEGRVRVSAIFDEYAKHLAAAGRKITKSAVLAYRRFVEHFGDVFVDQVDALGLRRYQRELMGGGLAKSTVDRHFAMYKAAWRYRYGEHGPWKQVKLFRPDNTLVRWLTPVEERALLKACRQSVNTELYGIVVMAMHTGLRARNITEMRWDQIDFERAVVTVRQKGSRRLTVPLNGACRIVLTARPRDCEYVFRNPETMAPYWGIPQKVWTRAKKEAGIDRPFRFHDLRHHFATKIATVAGSLGVVRDLMGHSDLSISGKYLHVVDGAKRNAVESLDNGDIISNQETG
jgi:integrase